MVIYIEETHISIRFLFGSIWASLTKVVFDTAAALFRCSSQPRDIISFLQHHDSYFTRRHNLIEKQIHSREYCSSTYSPKLNSCSNSVSFWCRQIVSHMETNGNQSLILSQVCVVVVVIGSGDKSFQTRWTSSTSPAIHSISWPNWLVRWKKAIDFEWTCCNNANSTLSTNSVKELGGGRYNQQMTNENRDAITTGIRVFGTQRSSCPSLWRLIPPRLSSINNAFIADSNEIFHTSRRYAGQWHQ